MGVDPLMVQCSELMRQNKLPSFSEIKSGKVSIDDLFEKHQEESHSSKSSKHDKEENFVGPKLRTENDRLPMVGFVLIRTRIAS